jgi:hypothetical protein
MPGPTLCLLLLSCLAAAAAPPREVLAKAKAAQGGAAWDRVQVLHTFGTLATSGLKGPVDALEDLVHGWNLGHYDLGPAKGGNGFDGTVSWTQDATGDARPEGGLQARQGAANAAYMATRAYWYPERWPAEVVDAGDRAEGGRTFHVVAITPKGGHVFEVWVDGGTWLFDRTREQTDGVWSTTFFSQYREVDGLKLPFAVRTTNGEAQGDTDFQVTRVVTGEPVDPKVFAMPVAALTDSGFLDGASAATVPFEFVLNHIFVKVTIDGIGPLRFFLDTGGVNVLTPGAAKVLGIKAEGSVQGSGVGEKTEAFGLAKAGRIQLGQAWMDRQTFYVIPSLADIGTRMGLQVDGIIGYELFRRFVIRIDHARGELTLSLPKGWSYQGGGTTAPFLFHGHQPQVEGEFDGLKGRFDLDTGSGSVLDLYTPFVKEHGLLAKYPGAIYRVSGGGVGGEVGMHDARARTLTLGGHTAAAPVVSFSTTAKGAFASTDAAGNVGEGFLRRFTVTFDYGRQELHLEPNALLGQPFPYTRAGVGLSNTQGAWKVEDVIAKSPAGEAGLRKGDLVLAVDGRSPGALSLDGLNDLLRSGAPGTRVVLRIKSGEAERDVALVLRELL